MSDTFARAPPAPTTHLSTFRFDLHPGRLRAKYVHAHVQTNAQMGIRMNASVWTKLLRLVPVNPDCRPPTHYCPAYLLPLGFTLILTVSSMMLVRLLRTSGLWVECHQKWPSG